MNQPTSVYYAEMAQSSRFDSVEQFNAFIRGVRYYFADQLNETDRILLDYMSRYSVKYFGVFGQKIATIGQALDKGTATVRRSLAKMERLGFLQRVPYIRPKRGGNGANLIVFTPDAVPNQVEDADDGATDHPGDCPSMIARTDEGKRLETREKLSNFGVKTQNHSNTSHKAPLKKKRITYDDRDGLFRESTEEEMDYSYAGYNIPPSFCRAIVPMGSSPRFVAFAWSKVLLAYRKSQITEFYSLETVLQDEWFLSQILSRTKSAVGAAKFGTIRKDFGALLYGTLLQVFNDDAKRLQVEMSMLPF
ncbi:hypothetical protein [Desmospora activa]|uniref:DeoR family transcriptional regulator n=1 Tax=Desmospora activa DSM 45169 TaxID=1121389 RepID=A0A2T4Z4L0_9BACL|nr:hypothetical protein [Desmospora activa]PTM56829.1 DeoR family transcriptional regulator [Desmospora activa DSM 45169]